MSVTVGQELPEISQTHSLQNSVMYAGASGDMNPLHYDIEFAKQVPPANAVIAHGMYSMGLASRVLTAFAGGPENVRSITVRFTKPWVTGTTVTFGGTVTAVEGDTATVELWARGEDGDQTLKGTGVIAV